MMNKANESKFKSSLVSFNEELALWVAEERI